MIAIEYPPQEKPVGFQLHYIIYGPEGKVFTEDDVDGKAVPDSTGCNLFVGRGWDEPGHWLPGSYRLEIYSEGNLAATGAFEITP